MRVQRRTALTSTCLALLISSLLLASRPTQGSISPSNSPTNIAGVIVFSISFMDSSPEPRSFVGLRLIDSGGPQPDYLLLRLPPDSHAPPLGTTVTAHGRVVILRQQQIANTRQLMLRALSGSAEPANQIREVHAIVSAWRVFQRRLGHQVPIASQPLDVSSDVSYFDAVHVVRH